MTDCYIASENRVQAAMDKVHNSIIDLAKTLNLESLHLNGREWDEIKKFLMKGEDKDALRHATRCGRDYVETALLLSQKPNLLEKE